VPDKEKEAVVSMLYQGLAVLSASFNSTFSLFLMMKTHYKYFSRLINRVTFDDLDEIFSSTSFVKVFCKAFENDKFITSR
jgi:hypothetical protein